MTHQLRDAFFIATHEAHRQDQRLEFQPVSAAKQDQTEFLMLRDGGVAFEGNAEELRASTDEYLQQFLT